VEIWDTLRRCRALLKRSTPLHECMQFDCHFWALLRRCAALLQRCGALLRKRRALLRSDRALLRQFTSQRRCVRLLQRSARLQKKYTALLRKYEAGLMKCAATRLWKWREQIQMGCWATRRRWRASVSVILVMPLEPGCFLGPICE